MKKKTKIVLIAAIIAAVAVLVIVPTIISLHAEKYVEVAPDVTVENVETDDVADPAEDQENHDDTADTEKTDGESDAVLPAPDDDGADPTEQDENDSVTDSTDENDGAGTTDEEEKAPEKEKPVAIDLGRGLKITSVASYAGMFVEDGSDEIVSGLYLVTVENTGSDYIQYASFDVALNDGTQLEFELTTLPAGQKAVVLEKNRMEVSDASVVSAELTGYSKFDAAPSLCSDTVQLLFENGRLTVRNISEKTITGGRVFYKNVMGDLLVGGITYMVSFEELEPNSSVTLNAPHFSDNGSRVMFVTYAE